MNRILFIIMMCLPMVAMAQENAAPKKVAVYVTSDDEKIDNTTKSIIGGELVNAIVKTRKYQAVERTTDFLMQITKEQGYQRSGNVDDGQISALGKQFGVHYVCVANVLPFRENIYIQTRLIDVETATVLAFAKEISSSSDLVEIIAASEKVAFALIGTGGSSSSYSTSSRPSAGQGNVLELEANEEDKIYDVVEEEPEFPGGMAALNKYFSENLRYPVMAQEMNIQGKVYVKFTVWKDGSVRDAIPVRSPDKSLEAEAVRLVSRMPKWKPGKQRGKAVNCKFTVPVTFKLQ